MTDQTLPERRFREALQTMFGNRLPFRQRVPVEGRSVYTTYDRDGKAIERPEVDFLIDYLGTKLIIEIDGADHGRTWKWANDSLRDAEHLAIGIPTLRIPNALAALHPDLAVARMVEFMSAYAVMLALHRDPGLPIEQVEKIRLAHRFTPDGGLSWPHAPRRS